jgi:hypothetical protein
MPRVASERPDFGGVVASLRSLRRTGLIAVALFALGIGLVALRADGETAGDVDRRVTYAALALAGVSILTRRSLSPSSSARSVVLSQVASVLSAVGLGLLGAVLAIPSGAWQVGLLYNAAAALLLFRPAALLSAPRPPR